LRAALSTRVSAELDFCLVIWQPAASLFAAQKWSANERENMRRLLLGLLLALPLTANAQDTLGEYLIKLKPGYDFNTLGLNAADDESGPKNLGNGWVHFALPEAQALSVNSEEYMEQIRRHPAVEYVQPNYPLGLIEDYRVEDTGIRRIVKDILEGRVARALLPPDIFPELSPAVDRKNSGPDFPKASIAEASGSDPMVRFQWGMANSGASQAWRMKAGSRRMIVAVIDTGVDYSHEDLAANMWRNPGEIPANGRDDDGNGYIDDVVGWDFIDGDNKPYDKVKGTLSIMLFGGNAGHGTHCAGNIGGVGGNAKGISGVSPQVSIMALRFLNDRGQGTTAGAIAAINYAVANGAKILSNSWAHHGENPKDAENNRALKEAITNAMKHDVLFVAAASNGRKGSGFNNDFDQAPAYPASYEIPNVISVAAIDSQNRLGKFSNWGKRTVHLGAPGVKIYSTMVGNKYSDKVFSFLIKTYWNGTSMATPHVAGAAALVWSAFPHYTAQDVKAKLLSSVDRVPGLEDKVMSNGKLNVLDALR
jgi:thermitase